MTNLGTESILCGELLRGELRPSDCDLMPDDFADAMCRAVFETVVQLEEQRREVSLVSLGDTHPALIEAAVPMVQLSETAFGRDSLQHAAIVRKDAQRRRLANVGKVLEDAAGNGGDPSEIANTAWEQLAAILSHEKRLGTKNMALTADAVLKRRKNPGAKTAAVPTGFSKLDTMLNGGFKAGDLAIVGARPGVGKSALLLSFVIHAAAVGKRVLYITMEMTDEQNAERYLGATSSMPVSWFVNDLPLTDGQLTMIADAQARQNPALIEQYDSSYCTVGIIRQLARRMKASGGLDLIVVDYLGLLTPTTRRQTRNDEVSEISRGLKTLAMEFSVPLVAAHQLNRASASEKREPELYDLRDSGAIEQDANAILLLHDPDADKRGARPAVRQISCKLAKNRQGAVGGEELIFNTNLMTFEEAEHEQDY